MKDKSLPFNCLIKFIYFLVFYSFKIDLVIWKRVRESFIHLFTPHMTAMTRAGSDTNQEPETPSESPMWVEGTHALGPSPTAFSKLLAGAESEVECLGCQDCRWQLNLLYQNSGARNSFLFDFKIYLFLFETQSYREAGRDGQRQSSAITGLLPKWLQRLELGQSKNKASSLFQISMWVQGPKHFAFLHCFPRHISRELD